MNLDLYGAVYQITILSTMIIHEHTQKWQYKLHSFRRPNNVVPLVKSTIQGTERFLSPTHALDCWYASQLKQRLPQSNRTWHYSTLSTIRGHLKRIDIWNFASCRYKCHGLQLFELWVIGQQFFVLTVFDMTSASSLSTPIIQYYQPHSDEAQLQLQSWQKHVNDLWIADGSNILALRRIRSQRKSGDKDSMAFY